MFCVGRIGASLMRGVIRHAKHAVLQPADKDNKGAHSLAVEFEHVVPPVSSRRSRVF